ncbi:2-acylglycerol O-acyltransferase 1 [Apodemus speciosus]|uniref:Acyltransferase n=1 Tax=Apodemus speciosus TaxID=105296 RepID=A0ABQ0EE07_APOSI
MKVEFAPLNIPLARRLQTAAVLQLVLTIVLLPQVCLGIMVMLVIYNYWFLYIPYLAWFYYDWRTPEQGGRRWNWVQSWTVWRYFKDYFPMRLIKTQDLDPGHNYIFGFHPHGIFVAGALGHFCTNYSDFKKLFPGFTSYLHVAKTWFWFPFFREYMMSNGAKEVLESHPGRYSLCLQERKGFVKLALTHGASLVPVFSFGENELYKQMNNPKGSWVRTVQDTIENLTGVGLPLIYARGIFQYSFGLMPYRKLIYTVVGRPIPVRKTLHPTPEQIEKLHQTYMEELKKLFNEHKGKYGIPEHETLVFK